MSLYHHITFDIVFLDGVKSVVWGGELISSHFTDGVTKQHVEEGPSNEEFDGDLGFNVENKVFLNMF